MTLALNGCFGILIGMLLVFLSASILIAQGLGHSIGFLAGWTSLPAGFNERPWLFSSGVGYTGWAGRLFGLLWLASSLAFLAAGFGLIFQVPAWPTYALIGASLSLLAILPWWRTVTPGPRHLATLVDLMVLVVLALPWSSLAIAVLLGG
jgi:hypothetical protein